MARTRRAVLMTSIECQRIWRQTFWPQFARGNVLWIWRWWHLRLTMLEVVVFRRIYWMFKTRPCSHTNPWHIRRHKTTSLSNSYSPHKTKVKRKGSLAPRIARSCKLSARGTKSWRVWTSTWTPAYSSIWPKWRSRRIKHETHHRSKHSKQVVTWPIWI